MIVAASVASTRTAASSSRGAWWSTPCRTLERAVREREREYEHQEPGHLLAGQAVTAADPEGEAPVRRGVADRGHSERDRAGGGGADRAGEKQEQQCVDERRRDADRGEARHRRGHRQAGDPAQVGDRRGHDVDARVGIVDPVDRNLVDAHSATLRRDQQLGVEEPRLIAHRVEELGQHVGAHRLEAALGVGEPRAQRDTQDAGCRRAR